jgi:hypothetical protein
MAGSLGYAERLSVRDDVGGRLGDPELLDEGASSCARVAFPCAPGLSRPRGSASAAFPRTGDAYSCPKVAALVELIRNAKARSCFASTAQTR